MAQNDAATDDAQTTNDLSAVRPGDLLRMEPDGRGSTIEGTVVAVYKNESETTFAVVQKSDRRTHVSTLISSERREGVREQVPASVTRRREASEVEVVPGGGNDDYDDRTREFLTEAGKLRFPVEEDEDEHSDIIRDRSKQAAYAAVARMDAPDDEDDEEADAPEIGACVVCGNEATAESCPTPYCEGAAEFDDDEPADTDRFPRSEDA